MKYQTAHEGKRCVLQASLNVCLFHFGSLAELHNRANTNVSRWKRQGSASSDAHDKRHDVVGFFFCCRAMLKEETSNCLAGTEAFGAGAKAAEDPPE